MNQTLILQLNKHDIYLLSDNNISFYISIPKTPEFQSVNISIDLKENFDKINMNKNDPVYVKDELTHIYQDIDYENITLVVPVFYNDVLERIRKIPSENIYSYLDKCISYIINYAYKILTSKQIKVNTKIVIVENEKFADFINWFSKRYSSRVDIKQYSELIGEFTSVIPVVSTSHIIEIPTDKINMPEGNIPLKESYSAGFVSYFLLGTIVVILTLLILYILL